MKILISITILSMLAWSAQAVDQSQVRVAPTNKFMTIEVDGQFPAGPATDVIFVIDDSGSMSSHQANLASHIHLLAQEAEQAGNSFHVGVVNTFFGSKSPFPGQGNTVEGLLLGNPQVITPQTNDLVTVLQNRLSLGTDGSGTESIFRPVMTALTSENTAGMNAGFLRENAHLSIVVLTDAEDQSNVSPWDFVDYLADLKGGVENVTMQSIMVTQEDVKNETCHGESKDGSPRIEEAIRLLQGDTFSLCSATMAQDIATLSSNVFPPFQGDFKPGILMDYVELVGTPEESSIKVQFGGQTLANDPALGWTYDQVQNRLNFGNQIEWLPQPKNTKVIITYKPIN